MEKQKTFQDQPDANAGEFIHKIAKRYNLEALAKGQIEFRSRSIGLPYEHDTDKFTDDMIYELIIRNHLVCLVYLRRKEANHTEANYVVFESVIDMLRKNQK